MGGGGGGTWSVNSAVGKKPRGLKKSKGGQEPKIVFARRSAEEKNALENARHSINSEENTRNKLQHMEKKGERVKKEKKMTPKARSVLLGNRRRGRPGPLLETNPS